MTTTDRDRMVRVPDAAGSTSLDRYFRITERGSTVRTEVVAGVATFLTMAYILFVNPQILGAVTDGTGTALPFDQVLTVTALVAGVATIAMGLFGKVPFALAAGLGLNGFVAFTLVGGYGLTWPEAMGMVVVEGLVIAALVLTGLRQAVMNAIPLDLKRAIGIGIGLFLVMIALSSIGLVVTGDGTVVALSEDLTTFPILVFAIGLTIASAMVARNVRGGLLLSILVTTAIAIAINEVWGDGVLWGETGVANVPSDVVASPDFSLVGEFSFGFFSTLGVVAALAPLVALMLSDFFDTMGTAVALGDEAGLLDREGRLPDMNRVLLVDSLAAAAGGAASASSNTTFIESASGISEGGRTGLTAVVTGVLFLSCLFISPLAGVIPAEATAPVLVVVGYLMMRAIGEIDWRDPAIGISSLLTVTLMPFTFSIANGIGAGFIAYTVIRTLQGKLVHPLMYAAAAVFLWYFVRGLIA